MMKDVLMVVPGGVAGGVLRNLVGRSLNADFRGGTLVVNVAGSAK